MRESYSTLPEVQRIIKKSFVSISLSINLHRRVLSSVLLVMIVFEYILCFDILVPEFRVLMRGKFFIQYIP